MDPLDRTTDQKVGGSNPSERADKENIHDSKPAKFPVCAPARRSRLNRGFGILSAYAPRPMSLSQAPEAYALLFEPQVRPEGPFH